MPDQPHASFMPNPGPCFAYAISRPNKEQGARPQEQGLRSKAQGLRSKASGARPV